MLHFQCSIHPTSSTCTSPNPSSNNSRPSSQSKRCTYPRYKFVFRSEANQSTTYCTDWRKHWRRLPQGYGQFNNCSNKRRDLGDIGHLEAKYHDDSWRTIVIWSRTWTSLQPCPLDTVFNKINKYVQIAQNAWKQVTQAQAISLAMIILKKTRVFFTYIVEWNRRPILQQIWNAFKNMFHTTQNELHNSNSLTLQEALAQLNANMVAQQVTDQILQHPGTNTASSCSSSSSSTPMA